jgi:hypothetical protein
VTRSRVRSRCRAAVARRQAVWSAAFKAGASLSAIARRWNYHVSTVGHALGKKVAR